MNKGSVNLCDKSHNFSDKLLDNYGRHISYILFHLFYLAFILALVSSSANTVSAQHKIDPEAWVKMRKMLWKKGPALTLEEDIATLTGPDFKRAGPRLIDHGSEALPAIHAAIKSPEIEPRLAARTEGKIPFCQEMLRSHPPGHLGIGIRCLLENGHANDLKPYAAVDLEARGRAAIIHNEISKAGWQIIDMDAEFSIVPTNFTKKLP